MAPPVLSVRSLSVAFGGRRVVDDVSFLVPDGEVVALVGESGSGKTLTALSLLDLAPDDATRSAESISLAGRELVGLSDRALCEVRGAQIGLVFQEPASALDPVRTVGAQLVEALRLHLPLSRKQASARAVELLARLEVPQPEVVATRFPHELSGGLRQRAMVAIATACEPALVVADEPTSSLDPITQVHVLDLLVRTQRVAGKGLLVVLHDLALARAYADRVVVLYAGRVVESGPVGTVLPPRAEAFARPPGAGHPYTRALVGCALEAGARARDASGRRLVSLTVLAGNPPDPANRPGGCDFAPRCPERGAAAPDACAKPVPLEGLGEHLVRCVLARREEGSS